MTSLIKHKLVLLALMALALATVSLAEAHQHKTDGGAQTIETPNQTCQDSVKLREGCRAFISGFLQGALLTDEAIITTIDAQESELSFTERAMKTRLGKRSNPPTELAGFCIPPDRTLDSIIEETLDHVAESVANSAELAGNVYTSLKTDYPCQQ